MDSTASFWLPPESSTMAGEIDSLFYFIAYVSIFFLGIVTFAIIYFGIKYRRRDDDYDNITPQMDHNRILEWTWSVIPSILVIIVFFWGFNVFMKMNIAPKDAIEIKVTGQKWFWAFTYPEGNNSINELIVPEGKAVKLLLSSKDVIHSFFIPDFRIKMDVLPNRYSSTWFEAKSTGVHNLFCTEYCGEGHSDMIAKIKVVSMEDYENQQASVDLGEGLTPVEYGTKLFSSKVCASCHSVGGKTLVGPPLNGVFGSNVPLEDGTTISADENYLRESILNPKKNVVAGYQPVMPTYQGLLDDKQLDALVAYIKSLKGEDHE